MRYGRLYYKPRGNMRTEVTTAFGVEGTVEAVKRINNRTKWRNALEHDALRYHTMRKKVTLPADITAWLKKEI